MCVSYEHVDTIRNSDVYYISTFIYNGVHTNRNIQDITKDEKLVVYVGILDRGKGFHHVADIIFSNVFVGQADMRHP